MVGARRNEILVSRKLFCLLCTRCASFAGELVNAAETLDTTPRTAVMSAYQPEWIALQAMLRDRKDHVINATIFAAGTIEGKPVVLFLSGVSMVPFFSNCQGTITPLGKRKRMQLCVLRSRGVVGRGCRAR
jgi:hypothetical protein